MASPSLPPRTPSPQSRAGNRVSPPRPWLTRSVRRVQLPPVGQHTVASYDAQASVATAVTPPKAGGKPSSPAVVLAASAGASPAGAGGPASSADLPGDSSGRGATGRASRGPPDVPPRRAVLRPALRPPTPPVQRDRSTLARGRDGGRSPSPDSPPSGSGRGKGKKGSKGKSKGKSKSKNKGKGKSKGGK